MNEYNIDDEPIRVRLPGAKKSLIGGDGKLYEYTEAELELPLWVLGMKRRGASRQEILDTWERIKDKNSLTIVSDEELDTMEVQ